MSLRASVSFSIGDSDECYGCSATLPGKQFRRYAFQKILEYKGVITTSVKGACNICADSDEAISDAIFNNRKFTVVGIGNVAGAYSKIHNEWDRTIGGPRCACGSATYRSKEFVNERFPNGRKWLGDFCINCSRNIRMVERAKKSHKLLSATLAILRKEIKTQTSNLKEI